MEYNLTCEYCGRSFARKYNLTRHVEEMHNRFDEVETESDSNTSDESNRSRSDMSDKSNESIASDDSNESTASDESELSTSSEESELSTDSDEGMDGVEKVVRLLEQIKTKSNCSIRK